MMVINGGRFCCCFVRGARWDGLSRGGTWGRASSRREEVNLTTAVAVVTLLATGLVEIRTLLVL